MTDIELRKKLDYLFDKVKKPISMDDILQNINHDEYSVVESILEEKVRNYELIKNDHSKYINIFKTQYRKGKFFSTPPGGIVLVDQFYTDKNGDQKHHQISYKIGPNHTMNAINNDTVMIDIGSTKGKKAENPRIIEIVDRKVKCVVGEVYKENNTFFLKPEDKNKDFVISLQDEHDLVVGEKLVVTLDSLLSNNFYTAHVKRRLGHKDDPGIDILLEAARHGIDMEFSKEALEQLESIPTKVLESDMVNRVDLSDLEIFTIDGEDTKDRDDAISLCVLENGNYCLGVHIADPAYYIPEDSPLDIDAKHKGTSTYLADTVIPMLPHKLSNGICSLNSGVLRLTQSCMIEFDPQGRVIDYNLFRSVIKSCLQMTYTNVNKILNHIEIPILYEKHANTLIHMRDLAEILYQKRVSNGSVEINRKELKVSLDDQGVPTSFDILTKGPGQAIVEEFMIAANEIISSHLIKNGFPSINRIHENPDREKILEFIRLLNITGNEYPIKDIGMDCQSIQKISKFVDQIENNEMLQLQFLKSLKRARYSSKETGHSGLAKKYYCHFTSPMRRYPDLTQNRILSDFIYSHPTEEEIKDLKGKWVRKLPEIDQTSSKTERLAGFCEVDVLNMKCAEYMMNHLGEEFEGIIIDMDNNSITVQLDNMMEGRVTPRYLEGKYFYNQDTRSLISLEGFEDYYLGDQLRVEVCGASKEKKVINLKIKEKLYESHNIIKSSNEKVKMQKRQRYFNSNKGLR